MTSGDIKKRHKSVDLLDYKGVEFCKSDKEFVIV